MKMYCLNPHCDFEFDQSAAAAVMLRCPKCGGGNFGNTVTKCPHCGLKTGGFMLYPFGVNTTYAINADASWGGR